MFRVLQSLWRKPSKVSTIHMLLCCSVIFMSCQPKQNSNPYELTAFNENMALRAVIEIPAGTNKKIEFNTSTKAFEIDQRDGKDRIIQYLPYPANYGFIPGTFSDPSKGGDGDALDILVICEALVSSSVIEVIPIGMFKLLDEGELDYKIIAIPKDKALQTVKATTLEELEKNYGNLTQIIAAWFMNYDKGTKQESLGWADEIEAMKEIRSQLKQ